MQSEAGFGCLIPPAPELPPEVVEGTLERYREAYRRLTGADIELDSTGVTG